MMDEIETNKDSRLTFTKVKKTEEHAAVLYKLLKKRLHSHNISNANLPTYDEHELFVFSNPYRAWYLIQYEKNYVGSLYLLKSNSVGIFLLPRYINFFAPAIEFLMATYKPLPLIKSVRAPLFSINISPENADLIKAIGNFGGKLVQQTYVIM
jgi:hypothetical protein